MSDLTTSEGMVTRAAATGGAAIEASIYARKADLRRSILKTLRSIAEPELRAQSDAVFRKLSQEDFYKSARSVGCYLSMKKGELQTDKIVHDLLSRGIKLYTPYIPLPSTIGPETTTNSIMHMLRLYSMEDLNGCPTDKWGILDPGENMRDTGEKRENAIDAGIDDLDLILIPGVAFDENCNRLGRGKAYYDNYLEKYISEKGKRPLRAALALNQQILASGEEIPTDSSDVTLDGIISPDKTIFIRS